MARLTRWWHGGISGLQVGDRILPAGRLDVLPYPYLLADEKHMEYPCDPSRVYLTTSRIAARAYASHYVRQGEFSPRGGDLYNVRPKGTRGVDPDEPGTSVTCDAAIVVAVVERGVAMTDRRDLDGLVRSSRWDTGEAMYSHDGYALPTDEMRARGITEHDLRAAGKGARVDSILVCANHLLLEREQSRP